MPSISLSSPGVPTLSTGSSPVAAAPAVAIDEVAPPAFASVIDGLGQGFTFDASLPLKPSVGKTLPPERPEIAGGPEPLPVVDVETVMVGSAATAAPPPEMTAEPAPDTPEQPPVGGHPAETTAAQQTVNATAPGSPPTVPVVDAEPVECGLQNWRLGGASRLTLARAIVRPIPAPVQLPTGELPDMPAVDPAPLSEEAHQGTSPKPKALPVADGPDPAPPPFAPIAWAPAPPPIADSPETGTPDKGVAFPSQPALAASAVTPQPASTTPGAVSPQPVPAEASTSQPAAMPASTPPTVIAQNPTALPNSFTLPPDVTREIAQLVQAAVGDRDEHRSSDASDPAPLPTISAPQIAPSQPAPLHPAFAASHRPVIDTGRAEWMQAMIDRIAEMPQPEGGRRDAQIRLVPDALGPVEVKIEQRQDRLHVTLQAETPQARQLLSDAAPKLHELAEARGIRFAQAGFGSADSQDRRHAPDQQQPATPLRPRPAANAADADSDSQTDGDLIA